MAIDDGTTVAVADPVFFARVVSNLLDNAAARRRWPPSSPSGVEVRPTGTTAWRSRSSTMAPASTATRSQLFLPFARLDERGRRTVPASGWRSRKGFLDLMDGEIWLEDTPGGGATFAFSLQEAA